MNRLQAENTPRTVNDTIAEQMQKLRVKDSPRLWKQDAKFYDAMNYDKMVSIYHDRFQDASDFTFYLVGNIQREEAQTGGEIFGSYPVHSPDRESRAT